MNKKLNMIYILFILTLNFSCIENKSTEKEVKNAELVISLRTGTLKFTSGIRAIFQDSKGNYWFGDRDTGAWKFGGNTLKNYSITNKQTNPMIWTLYKDKNNNLLFGMADGSIFKFNGKTLEKQF